MIDSLRPLIVALMHEGSLLYPYRTTLKNARPSPLWALVPRAYADLNQGSDLALMQAECLLTWSDQTNVTVHLHALQVTDEQCTVERTVACPPIAIAPLLNRVETIEFSFGSTAGGGRQVIRGAVSLDADAIDDNLVKIRVRISNDAALLMHSQIKREEVLPHALISPQLVMTVCDGLFMSSIDPPPEHRSVACRNIGVWPVLVGEPGSAQTMLASPIILEDYPRIAPQSPGDFFDATEMDEMLSLRMMTLADHEKAQLAGDARTRALLDRIANLSHEDWLRLHGTIRAGHNCQFRTGDRVILRPRSKSRPRARLGRLNGRAGADCFDIILAGQVATIVAVERDFEDRIHLAVTIDDDPGAAEGRAGIIGHRFFFSPDEVERLQ